MEDSFLIEDPIPQTLQLNVGDILDFGGLDNLIEGLVVLLEEEIGGLAMVFWQQILIQVQCHFKKQSIITEGLNSYLYLESINIYRVRNV